MEAVLELLNPHARVVLCGLIAEYAQDGKATGPRNFSTLLMRRVHLQGFNVLDARHRFAGAMLRLALWLALGRIKDRHTLITGLAEAPAALKGLFDGDNIGKLIVQVAE